MSQLIDGNELVRSLKMNRLHILSENENNGAAVYDDIIMWISHAPTIDAVPVMRLVRCKNCKHAFERSGRKPFGCYLYGKNGITLHDGDDFCSHGERKDIE